MDKDKRDIKELVTTLGVTAFAAVNSDPLFVTGGGYCD